MLLRDLVNIASSDPEAPQLRALASEELLDSMREERKRLAMRFRNLIESEEAVCDALLKQNPPQKPEFVGGRGMTKIARAKELSQEDIEIERVRQIEAHRYD